jgi:hypothetical protein
VDAAADHLISQEAEPALDLVDPEMRIFLNSAARWRRCSSEITVPSAVLKAAKRREYGGAVRGPEFSRSSRYPRRQI